MSEVKLNKEQYAKLKNLSYKVCIMDHLASSNKAEKVMNSLLEEYDNDELKNIVYSTLLFPYDVELSNFLENKSLNETTLELASDKFDIPISIIKQKTGEYVKYSFKTSVDEGLIDYSDISQLAEQLFEKDNEKEPMV